MGNDLCESYIPLVPENDPFSYMDQLDEDVKYDSDHIDSDIEETLYTFVHHQTISSQELSIDTTVKSVSVNGRPEERDGENVLNGHTSTSYKLLNQRDCMKKERDRLRKLKFKQSQQEKPKNGFKMNEEVKKPVQLDISYGNDICLDGIDIESEMNRFYNEDDYDSDEQSKLIRRMPSDRRYWRIDMEDIIARQRGKRALYRGKTKLCRVCLEPGHFENHCPKKEKVCYICGEKDHLSSKCRAKQCSICFSKGHLSDRCGLRYSTSVQCNICRITGHTDVQCTFHWRRFLTITDEEKYSRVKQTKTIRPDTVTVSGNISCYNCGMSGSHFAHECTSQTINRKRFEIPSPILNLKRRKVSPKKNPRPPNKKMRQMNGGYDSPIVIDSDVDSDDSIEFVMKILKQSKDKKQSTQRPKKGFNRKAITINVNKSPNQSNKSKKKKKRKIKCAN